MSPASLEATPPGRLLYYPYPPPEPDLHPNIFAEAELFEFVESQPAEALRAYERIAQSKNTSVRAEALLRSARVLRNMGRRDESIAAYQKLANINASAAGAPAELVARHAMCDLAHSPHQASQLKEDLRSGRWRLTRGQFEFYLVGSRTPVGTSGATPS